MQRQANILVDMINQKILVTPLGKFRGDGGYYPILPFSEITIPCASSAFAALVVDALKHSEKTAYRLQEYLTYFHEAGDKKSLELRQKYYPHHGSTASRAKQYAQYHVIEGKDSWK